MTNKLRPYICAVFKRSLLILGLYPLSMAAGFAAGTLIKTPIGHERIENLKKGDVVTSIDKDGQISIDVIESVYTNRSNRLCVLVINYSYIITSQSQIFFISTNRQPKEAKYINTVDDLFSYELLPKFLDKNVKLMGNAKLININLKNDIGYFISEYDIATHNSSYLLHQLLNDTKWSKQ